MRTIKPGKLLPKTSGLGTSGGGKPSQSSRLSEREIWDDYLVGKKDRTRRKKEYVKGEGNRMVPTAHVSSSKLHLKGTEDEQTGPSTEASALEYRPSSDYRVIEERFSYSFRDKSLLQRALTHRSALIAKERADYERLEFLGDAVLDLSVADVLSQRYPEAREGELSKMRAALVNTKALAEIAQRLELSPFIRLGRGEYSSGGAERPSILADVMEAVIGAIYRDSGFTEAMHTVKQIYGDSFDQVTPYDPKTELQEALHAAGSEPPEYLLELVEGPEHAPTFVTVVFVDGEIVGRGKGATKKGAQQEAAAEALSKLVSDAVAPELIEGQGVFIVEAFLSNNIFIGSQSNDPRSVAN